MIPANELRIGNWVNKKCYGGTQFLIEKIDGSYIKWVEDGSAACEPIPLSPEILEKLGFVEKDRALLERHGFRNFFHKKAVVQLGTNIIKTWVGKMREPVEHLKSLHQFQNLYFALTDEELNYTP